MPAAEPEGALLAGGGGGGSSWQAVATTMRDLSFTSVKKCEGERDRRGDMAVYLAGPLRRHAVPSAHTTRAGKRMEEPRQKFCQNLQIHCHIESLNTYMKH